MAVLTVLLFVTVSPAWAATRGFTIAPASISGQGIPGGRGGLPDYTVSNGTGVPMHVVMSMVPDPASHDLAPAAEWFTFIPAEFDLAPNTEQQVSVRIAIPGDVQLGNYTAFVHARGANPIDSALSFNLILNARVNIVVATSLADYAKPITRAEFAGMLADYLGLVGSLEAGDHFIDVDGDLPYAQATEAVFRVHLMAGVSENAFGPNEPLTREQLAVILCRVATISSKRLVSDVTFVVDVLASVEDGAEVSPWARGPVAEVLQAGLLASVPGGRCDPKGQVGRNEAAAALNKLLGREEQ